METPIYVFAGSYIKEGGETWLHHTHKIICKETNKPQDFIWQLRPTWYIHLHCHHSASQLATLKNIVPVYGTDPRRSKTALRSGTYRLFHTIPRMDINLHSTTVSKMEDGFGTGRPVVPLSRCPVVPLAGPVGGSRWRWESCSCWKTFCNTQAF